MNQEIEGVKIFPKESQVLKDGREIAYHLCQGLMKKENLQLQPLLGNRRLILNPPPCGYITRKAFRY